MQGLAVAVAMGAAIMLSRSARTLPVGLPEYVQIITDDPQLAAELALANACERFERTEGRLVVVECTLPGSAGPRW
ncbi:MAG: hypothetical protein EBQ99_01645 [Planctomycetes bacterium]|nr:hypothetical protein [Planctomycetota bacterium]